MMKKPRMFMIALSLTIGWAAYSQAVDFTKLDGHSINTDEIDKIVTDLMDSANVTGLCLALLNENELVYLKTYGYRNRETRELLDENSIIWGASFSKVVLGYVAMQLVQEGVLALDTPLFTYLEKPLPEYDHYKDLATDERWKLLTVRHCLSHTTGFPNLRTLNPLHSGILEIFFEPGTRFAYSGEGIGLLQFVIEQVTNTGLEELAVERVFKPLGMTRTSYVWQDRFEDNFAVGHDILGSPLKYRKMTRADGGGSLITTISDYARFVEGIMQAKGLDEPTWSTMLSPSIRIKSKHQFPTISDEETDQYDPIALSYGLGWGLMATDFGAAFFKEGHGNGWQNYNVNFVDQKTSMLIMTNSDNGESIFKDLLERVMGDTFTPWEWENYIPYHLAKPRSIGVYIYEIILFENVDRAIETYKEIARSSSRSGFVFNEGELNNLGYQMIKENKLDAAIELFELNVSEYPESANVYDSQGEAYMKSGLVEQAIESYERSLELDPTNDNAREMLKLLRGSNK